MIRIKFLLSCFIGTLVYVAISGLFGANGLNSYRELEEQKREISKHTAQIQNINDELVLEKAALSSDKDLIAAYARKLDYVSDGEKLVKINGLKPAQNTLYNTGSVLRRRSISFVTEDVCKLVGICFALISFIIFILFDISTGKITFEKKRKIEVIQGIPVYDVPQI